jgi:polygalacturonase
MKFKRSTVLLALALSSATYTYASLNNNVAAGKKEVSKNREKQYNIADHGAIGDGKTINTSAIQATIDKIAKDGGGTLLIPKGVFISGSLFLKPGVNIQLEEGSVLKGSPNINDYKKLNTRIEGHFEPWRAALINGDQVDHLRISGPGTLDGSGEGFYKEFYSRREANKSTTNLSVERPRLTFIQNSKDVKISSLLYLNSGFWNLHIYRCKDVVIENCRFQAPSGPTPNRGPSSDGIDVDSSQDIEIKGCSFSVGDDCIALKGSKGPFAMQDKDSPAVERVSITDCVFEAGGGIVTCGSEATIVKDVDIKRCVTKGPTVLRLKLRPDTPQHYEGIRMSDITMENGGVIFKVSPWTQYFDLKGQEAPSAIVRDIVISNVRGTGTSFGTIIGHAKASISDITVKNVDLQLTSLDFQLGDVKGLKLKNVKVNGKPMPVPASSIAANKF